MAFPYGLSLASFLDAYNQAEQRALQGRGTELREALALRQLTEGDRVKREEEQVLEALVRDEASRRGAMPAPAGMQVIPGGMPAVPGMQAEAALAGMTAGPPVSAAPFMPGPSPRAPALSTLSPESAVRVRASPTGQRVLQSVKEAEEAAEKRRLKEESQEFFKLGSQAMNAGDAFTAATEFAKGYNRLEQYDRGSHYTDQAMKLAQDTDERKKANADLARWKPFVEAYLHRPSLKTEEELIEALGRADSLFGQTTRQDILARKLKTALGKDVYVGVFEKEIEERAERAGEEGRAFDLDKIYADFKREKPAVFWRGAKSNLEGNKAWGEKLIKALGGRTDLDPKDLQTAGAQALVAFRHEYGRDATEADFPKVQEISNRIRKAQKEAEAEAATTPVTRKDIVGALTAAGWKPDMPGYQQAYLNIARQVSAQGIGVFGAGQFVVPPPGQPGGAALPVPSAALPGTQPPRPGGPPSPLIPAPATPEQLTHFMDKETLQPPAPHTTLEEIRKSGRYVAVPNAFLPAMSQMRTTAALLDSIETIIRKRDDLFPPLTGKTATDALKVTAARAKYESLTNSLSPLKGTDVDVATFDSNLIAMPATVRAFGDVGQIPIQEREISAQAIGMRAGGKQAALARIENIRALLNARLEAQGVTLRFHSKAKGSPSDTELEKARKALGLE